MAVAPHSARLKARVDASERSLSLLHFTKVCAIGVGPGDFHALPPYPRHNLAPKPRNTSTSWNSESHHVCSFRAHTRAPWLAGTGLPWVWGWTDLSLVELLVRLGTVLSLTHPLDVFVACQVLQLFSHLNFYSFYFALALDWPGLIRSVLSSHIPCIWGHCRGLRCSLFQSSIIKDQGISTYSICPGSLRTDFIDFIFRSWDATV